MDVLGNALAATTALAGGTVNGLVDGVVAWSHGLKDQRLCYKELRLLRYYYLVLRHASFLDTIERERE
jgi:hypothetical protein